MFALEQMTKKKGPKGPFRLLQHDIQSMDNVLSTIPTCPVRWAVGWIDICL